MIDYFQYGGGMATVSSRRTKETSPSPSRMVGGAGYEVDGNLYIDPALSYERDGTPVYPKVPYFVRPDTFKTQEEIVNLYKQTDLYNQYHRDASPSFLKAAANEWWGQEGKWKTANNFAPTSRGRWAYGDNIIDRGIIGAKRFFRALPKALTNPAMLSTPFTGILGPVKAFVDAYKETPHTEEEKKVVHYNDFYRYDIRDEKGNKIHPRFRDLNTTVPISIPSGTPNHVVTDGGAPIVSETGVRWVQEVPLEYTNKSNLPIRSRPTRYTPYTGVTPYKEGVITVRTPKMIGPPRLWAKIGETYTTEAPGFIAFDSHRFNYPNIGEMRMGPTPANVAKGMVGQARFPFNPSGSATQGSVGSHPVGGGGIGAFGQAVLQDAVIRTGVNLLNYGFKDTDRRGDYISTHPNIPGTVDTFNNGNMYQAKVLHDRNSQFATPKEWFEYNKEALLSTTTDRGGNMKVGALHIGRLKRALKEHAEGKILKSPIVVERDATGKTKVFVTYSVEQGPNRYPSHPMGSPSAKESPYLELPAHIVDQIPSAWIPGAERAPITLPGVVVRHRKPREYEDFIGVPVTGNDEEGYTGDNRAHRKIRVPKGSHGRYTGDVRVSGDSIHYSTNPKK